MNENSNVSQHLPRFKIVDTVHCLGWSWNGLGN